MSNDNIIYEGQQILDCLDYDREMITGSDYEKGYENLQENEDSLGYSDKERWCRFKCDMECINALDSETQDLLNSIFESPDNLCSYHLNMLERLVDCKYSLSDKYQNAIEQTQKKLENYKDFKSSQLSGVREILEKLERDGTLNEEETVILAQYTKGYCEKFLCDVAENATKAVNALPDKFDNLKREHPESHIASESQNCLINTKLLQHIRQTCDLVEREHVNHDKLAVAEVNAKYVTPHPDLDLVKLKVTSQNGELRYRKEDTLGNSHEGVDYSMRGHSGIIMNPHDRKAIVISVNRDYGTDGNPHHPAKSRTNANKVTIAYAAKEEHEELMGIYSITYRHMNRVPSNIREGENLTGTGDEILGDYRVIIHEKFLKIGNNKEIKINGEKKNIEGLNVKIANSEFYLQKIDSSSVTIEIQKGDKVEIGGRINFINGNQDDHGYDLDGNQFFEYDIENNQVRNEHLHIEKRYYELDENGKKKLDQGDFVEAINTANRSLGADSTGQISGGLEILTQGTELYQTYIQKAEDFLKEVEKFDKDDDTRIIRDIAALYVMYNLAKQAQTFNSSNPCSENRDFINGTLEKVENTIKALAQKLEEAKFYQPLKDALQGISL